MLWEILRDRKFGGYKFPRQHPIQDYIADFYCHELALVIELDGGYHNTAEQMALDGERDKKLQEAGINCIRITNDELLFDTDQCLQALANKLNQSRLKKTRNKIIAGL